MATYWQHLGVSKSDGVWDPSTPRDFFFFKILFIHERERQREKQAPCREPDVGLDPGSPGSRPGRKADAQLLSHPGVPKRVFKRKFLKDYDLRKRF